MKVDKSDKVVMYINPNVKHGARFTRTYRIWRGMLSRCRHSSRRDWMDYGGRGIRVCDSWLKFENFLADMGEAPPLLTLDRKDVNGNYEPDNCRWATTGEQANNRTDSHILTAFGESKSIAQWVADPRCLVAKDTLGWRARHGVPHEIAITTPPASRKSRGIRMRRK